MTALWIAADAVQLNPDTTALPGGAEVQKLLDGLGAWALWIALAGVLLGAAAWAIGSHGQNYGQATNGRRAVLASALAALIVGAAPPLVNFFFHAGQRITG